MKFNHNNQPKSFPLVSFLGLVAIATSIVTTASKPLSNTEAVTSNIEQQSQNLEQIKPFKPNDSKGNDQTWLEVELEKEWSDILGDQPEKKVLLARGV